MMGFDTIGCPLGGSGGHSVSVWFGLFAQPIVYTATARHGLAFLCLGTLNLWNTDAAARWGGRSTSRRACQWIRGGGEELEGAEASDRGPSHAPAAKRRSLQAGEEHRG